MSQFEVFIVCFIIGSVLIGPLLTTLFGGMLFNLFDRVADWWTERKYKDD